MRSSPSLTGDVSTRVRPERRPELTIDELARRRFQTWSTIRANKRSNLRRRGMTEAATAIDVKRPSSMHVVSRKKAFGVCEVRDAVAAKRHFVRGCMTALSCIQIKISGLYPRAFAMAALIDSIP